MVKVFALSLAVASPIWQLSVESFPSGIYTVRLTDEQGRVLGTGKLVK